MVFSKAHIFVFSGTGNTHRAACWAEETLRSQDIPTRMSPIDVHGPTGDLATDEKTLVGIFNPAHGFTAPWKVIKFALGMPKGHGARAFCLTTRAGVMFGSYHLPGLAGSSCFLLALILWLKGYRVRGTKSVNMPSNWYSLHPIQKSTTHTAILQKAKPTIQSYAETIAADRN